MTFRSNGQRGNYSFKTIVKLERLENKNIFRIITHYRSTKLVSLEILHQGWLKLVLSLDPRLDEAIIIAALLGTEFCKERKEKLL